MADNVKNLIDLTPEQRSALMILLRQKAERKDDRNPNEKPIEKISRSGDLPLSYAQQKTLLPNWESKHGPCGLLFYKAFCLKEARLPSSVAPAARTLLQGARPESCSG